MATCLTLGNIRPLLENHLRQFEKSGEAMSGEDWADYENDLIVADYFSMLTDELSGIPINKASHRRSLVPMLNDRNEGSVEFKHQNISAVLTALGQQRINGYKPLPKRQNSLVDAVMRWLEAKPVWTSKDFRSLAETPSDSVHEQPALWIGPAPTFANEPSPLDPVFMAAVARKYDVAERDARNRSLGKAGEQRMLLHEKSVLRGAGRDDLAEKVRWTAVEDGDGAGFDIFSFEPDGRDRLIEVKTTNGWERTPFHVTRNELRVAEANRDTWHLVRLWNFAREPKAFAIRPPLEAHVSLTPTSFLASLQ
jgi:hypothetical protein